MAIYNSNYYKQVLRKHSILLINNIIVYNYRACDLHVVFAQALSIVSGLSWHVLCRFNKTNL